MAAARISVVIPSYNAREHIGACLVSVLAQRSDEPFEVVVADSSDDGTKDLVAREPRVKLLTLPRRTSAGAARNAGARAAEGALLVFLDADCVAPAGWLQGLVDAARAHGDVVGGGVAPRPPHRAVGLVLHALSFSGFLPAAHRSPSSAAFVPSCNMAIERELFLSLDGFPERYVRVQDVAFGHVARAAGRAVVFVPDAFVEHAQRGSVAEAMRHQWASGYWSGQLRARAPMRGSVLTRVAFAGWLLAPYRFLAVLARLLRARGFRWMAAVWLALAPLSVGLLLVYAAGFTRGARARP